MNCNHTRTYLEGHQMCIFTEGVDKGVELEQERIIKLLDENLGKVNYEDLIQLIKGE